MNGTERKTFSNERLACFWKVYINKKSKKKMSQPHQQTNGFSFQSSLKSQDDSSIKYEAFNDEDYNKEAHNIEKVIIVIILNIHLRSYCYEVLFVLHSYYRKDIRNILCYRSELLGTRDSIQYFQPAITRSFLLLQIDWHCSTGCRRISLIFMVNT